MMRLRRQIGPVWSTDTTPSSPAPSCGSVKISPQLTAFFTSAPIRASSAEVNSFSAKEVGRRQESSRMTAHDGLTECGQATRRSPSIPRSARLSQILDLFAEDSQRRVYAGELDVRPP